MVQIYSAKTDGRKIVGEGLTVAQFACKDKSFDEVLIDDALIDVIERLADHFKKAVVITSGYRPRVYNVRVGGAKNSQHIYGKAADIAIAGVEPLLICREAERMGLGGIGLYATSASAHIDTRSGKVRWWQSVRGGRYESVKGFGGVAVTLRKGDKGPAVSALCEKLCQEPSLHFDGGVEAAVKAYQAHNSLAIDGIVGKKTWASLLTDTAL